MLFSLLHIKSKSLIVAIMIAANIILTYIPLNHSEAQNVTDDMLREVKTPIPDSCDQGMISNSNFNSTNTFNFSSDEAVADIKCHLQEARNAIGAGAADSALLQINEAQETLLASHNRSSDRVP